MTRDLLGVAGDRLVHGVVHDLVDEVVQAAGAGGADVHAGALADRLEPLEDGDVLGAVAGASSPWRSSSRRPSALAFALARRPSSASRPSSSPLRFLSVHSRDSPTSSDPARLCVRVGDRGLAQVHISLPVGRPGTFAPESQKPCKSRIKSKSRKSDSSADGEAQSGHLDPLRELRAQLSEQRPRRADRAPAPTSPSGRRRSRRRRARPPGSPRAATRSPTAPAQSPAPRPAASRARAARTAAASASPSGRGWRRGRLTSGRPAVGRRRAGGERPPLADAERAQPSVAGTWPLLGGGDQRLAGARRGSRPAARGARGRARS